jgi:protein involved in polysaccharide export with SLBB domain
MSRALLLGLFLGLASLSAAEPANPPPASWHQHYLLGPGDILSFGLYGHPELERTQIFIQPDGTISYLQAQNLKAEGLTIDELRVALEKQLSTYYRFPRVIVSPFELRSKKYFILGKVVDKGAYSMDRPTTILEAVARARGIETGLFEQNTVELADLEHSFLSRGNKRIPVDFQKLFFEGDLTQNVELEPGDFLFFSSVVSNDLYMFGEVVQPGVLGFSAKLTVLGAITRREGFTRAAYRDKVLVIRGSLHKPEIFVIDTNAILKGEKPDFFLQPKDIVYVNANPWNTAEEILDSAVGAFVQSAVTTWTGASFGPFIKNAILPKTKVR